MGFLNKITVRARITALFALFIILMVIFGAFALQRMGTLAELTRVMHAHPLQVSNAALRAQAGVLRIEGNMKDVIMSQSQMETNTSIQEILNDEKEVHKELALVKELILGEEGKKLALETIEMVAGWKPIRVEIEELILKGNRAAAGEITQKKEADYVLKLERQMKELSGYARKKADGFMANADEIRQQTIRIVLLTICLVAIVCFIAAFFVINSITRSLGYLKDKMAASTGSGEMSLVEIEGKNEIADLSSHFNALVKVVREQLWLRNNLNELNREISGNITFEEMTDKSICFVSRALDACAGAFYLHDRTDSSSNLVASYAFVERKFLANRFLAGEGLIGQVVVEKKPILLQNISRDEACANSGTVSEPPRNIYAVPVTYEHELLAVMEIATFEALTPMKKQFVDEAMQIVASQLNTSMQNRQIQDLFRKSQMANEELQTKTDQINASNNELSALNKELQAQSNELQAQRDELQAQRDELQAQASELDKKRIQVEEADRLKSEFLSNMSHELRTPLNSIMSLSQLMISRGVSKDPEKATEYLKVIDRNGRQLLNLINDILDLTKIESGRMDIYPTEFQAGRIIERVIETAHPLADKKGLRLEKQIEVDTVLFSDEDKVYQILLNFLSNAIKFTEKGTVNIQVTEQGRKVFFTVSDTGIGISAENLNSIFDEFRQVDGSFTREHEGTGLGLAISKKLSALLGGEITVQSTPGAGSTFTLALPLSFSGTLPAYDNSSFTPLPSVSPAAVAEGPTVLIIDDDEGARSTLATYLGQEGYKTVTAGNGKTGLALARSIRPDVITLDLLMPNMDGWEVIRQLKSAETTADIPVIITSVSKDKDTGWALGAAGYITKPVDAALLLAEISRVSGKSSARRVLVVDDDAAVQAYMQDLLQEKGFIVETVGNGRDALEKVATTPPDLMVLDLLMPEMDGFAVMEQLRKSPITRNLPVIILTARDLAAQDFRRLESAVKTIRKDKLNKETFLQQIVEALECRKGKPVPKRVGSPLILVVEDNEIASAQICTALQENGFKVVVAKDGEEGLEHVRQEIPDGIVLDLMMPKIDGFQVLEQIRSRPETANLPVLILTAKELTAAERSRLTHNHIQQLIQKGSTDRDQLVASVRRMLSVNTADDRNRAATEAFGKRARSAAASILLVEDNADNRLTVSAILEGNGYELLIAVDGEQGVRMASEKRPDIILMDIQLPVMDGLQAINVIKSDPATRHIPIIAVSARAMKGEKERILAAGADDYIPKPINPDELLDKVTKWLL